MRSLMCGPVGATRLRYQRGGREPGPSREGGVARSAEAPPCVRGASEVITYRAYFFFFVAFFFAIHVTSFRSGAPRAGGASLAGC